MPSDYTKNYKLNQWEPEDKVLRTDFNADNKKIDDAIKAQADAIATEKSARETAVASLTSTLNAKGNCTVSTFTYYGNGQYGQDKPTKVYFPKMPVAYIIYGDHIMIGQGGVGTAIYTYSISSGGSGVSAKATAWSGSTLSMYDTSYPARQMNLARTYYVIAFYN